MSKRYRLKKEPVEYNGYLVYKDGRIFSPKTNTFLSPGKMGRYWNYSICTNGVKINITKHRIIAICYIPNPFNLPMVRHIDDNSSNNDINNLAWGTDYDNKQDAKKNGRYKTGNFGQKGQANHKSILTNEQVLEIRKRYDSGERCKDLGEIYSVGADQICRIGKRRQWKHLLEKQIV